MEGKEVSDEEEEKPAKRKSGKGKKDGQGGISKGKKDTDVTRAKCIETREAATQSTLPLVHHREVEKAKRPIDYTKWQNIDSDEEDNEQSATAQDPKRQEQLAIDAFKVLLTQTKQIGRTQFSRHDYSSAYTTYTSCLTQFHSSPSLQTLHTYLSSFPNALIDFLQIIVNAALCLNRLERFEEAEGKCTEAIKLEKRFAKGFWRRAEARRGLGDVEGAFKDVEQTLKLVTGEVDKRWCKGVDVKEVEKRLHVLREERDEWREAQAAHNATMLTEVSARLDSSSFEFEAEKEDEKEEEHREEAKGPMWNSFQQRTETLTSLLKLYGKTAAVLIVRSFLDSYLDSAYDLFTTSANTSHASKIRSLILPLLQFLTHLCAKSCLAQKRLSATAHFVLISSIAEEYLGANEKVRGDVEEAEILSVHQHMVDFLVVACEHDLFRSSVLSKGSLRFGNAIMTTLHEYYSRLLKLSSHTFQSKQDIPALLHLCTLLMKLLSRLLQHNPVRLQERLGIRVVDMKNIIGEFWLWVDKWYDGFAQPWVVKKWEQVMPQEKWVRELVSGVMQLLFVVSSLPSLPPSNSKAKNDNTQERVLYKELLVIAERIVSTQLVLWEQAALSQTSDLQVPLAAYHNLITKCKECVPTATLVDSFLNSIPRLSENKTPQTGTEELKQVYVLVALIMAKFAVTHTMVAKRVAEWLNEEKTLILAASLKQLDTLVSASAASNHNAQSSVHLSYQVDLASAWLQLLCSSFHYAEEASEPCTHVHHWNSYLQRQGIITILELLPALSSLLGHDTFLANEGKTVPTLHKMIGNIGYLVSVLAKDG
jgi:tetratricopeptide (TPR) repeat protein